MINSSVQQRTATRWHASTSSLIAFGTVPLVISLGLWMEDLLAPFGRGGTWAGVGLGLAAALMAVFACALLMRRHRRRAAASEAVLLADAVADVIAHLDLSGRLRFVSAAAGDLLGYAPADLVGTLTQASVHLDDRVRLVALFDDFAVGRIDRTVDVHRFRHRDGNWIWIEASLRLLRNADGTSSSIAAVLRDISDRRRTEAGLRASEARFRLLAENASELIILGKEDGTRTYISSASRRLCGFSAEELDVEMKANRWVHPDDHDQLARASVRPDLATRVICRVRHRDGSWIWVEAIVRRFAVESADEPSVIATFRDVSEHRAQADSLRRAKAGADEARKAAEQASQAKTDFLAAMSHEIRTPLNAVLGYADQLLLEPAIGGENRLRLERIYNAGSALRTVVDDVLDFSKIEAGRIDLRPEPFRPGTLIENAVSIVRGLLQAKGLDLVVDLGPDVSTWVSGDHDRLRQVLLNFLNNAIKFTAEGHITLSLRRLRGQDGANRLRFAVEDTGIGIAEGKLPLLFQRFSQVDGSISREFGGTGLGLAICKRLVEAMNGEVGAQSTLGKGSLFWFEVPLPLVPGPKSIANEAAVPMGEAARILLVEDLAINRELARTVLELGGHVVDEVDNGAAAVAAVVAARYDVVLMDVQMPVMDGLEATRRIRALGSPASRVPILAMTADVLPTQVARFGAAGMDGYVGKPCRRDDLLTAVAEHVRLSPPAAEIEADDPAFDRTALDGLACPMGLPAAEHIMARLVDESAAIEAMSDADEIGTRARGLLTVA